jgi:hypothetical protein
VVNIAVVKAIQAKPHSLITEIVFNRRCTSNLPEYLRQWNTIVVIVIIMHIKLTPNDIVTFGY